MLLLLLMWLFAAVTPPPAAAATKSPAAVAAAAVPLAAVLLGSVCCDLSSPMHSYMYATIHAQHQCHHVIHHVTKRWAASWVKKVKALLSARTASKCAIPAWNRCLEPYEDDKQHSRAWRTECRREAKKTTQELDICSSFHVTSASLRN
jgi:hypothetical protein